MELKKLGKSIPILIGIALCLTFVGSSKDWWGVIFAICVSVLGVGLFFFILAFGRALAKAGYISPWLGAWIANIIYGVIASFAITYECKSK